MSKLKDIEKLDELPYKESRKNQLSRGDIWNYRRGENHKVDGVYPWTHVQRILKSHIGKSFDKAFTLFCSIVPDYQQKWFLEEFEHVEPKYNWYDVWYVDKNGNIQIFKYERKKEPVSFSSNDYKVELRHRLTGHKQSEFEKIVKHKKYTSYYVQENVTYEYGTAYGQKMKPLKERYVAKEEDFVPVAISGWIKYFKSKNDREFKRLMAERVKTIKKKTPRVVMSDLECRAILKAKEKKIREEAMQMLEAKGMRPNAFTRIKTDSK